MNAIAETPSVRTRPRAVDKMLMLLRREFWEHKGGFFWAPLIAGGIFLLFSLLAGGAGQMFLQREMGGYINVNGQNLPINEIDWDRLARLASPEDLRQLGLAFTNITLIAGLWPLMIFGVAVFFYLLGALYDERKDRSVLFWKSLPVSDAQTVWSKVAMALLAAPLLAACIGLAVMLGFMVIFSGFIVLNGHNPLTIYLLRLDPVLLLGGLFGWIPIYALWALPTVGWLLLCSAWARSKPFLWAIVIPVFSAIVISAFDLLRIFRIDSDLAWQHGVARLLGSAWPGGHLLGLINRAPQNFDFSASRAALRFSVGIDVLGNPSLWIGAVAGIAMIVAATRLRRWRDDG